MTKDEWLQRCGNMYDMGLTSRETTVFLRDAVDTFVRLRHVYKKHAGIFEQITKNMQGKIAIENIRMGKFDPGFGELSGDKAYKAIKLAAVIDNPCNLCANDPHAWHTRYAFCEHKGGE